MVNIILKMFSMFVTGARRITFRCTVTYPYFRNLERSEKIEGFFSHYFFAQINLVTEPDLKGCKLFRVCNNLMQKY